jgi:hypothetical protein
VAQVGGWVREEHLVRLLILLAQPPGSAVVSVRVEGTMDLVLATRIETLLDVL